jgi:hypothetical protein
MSDYATKKIIRIMKICQIVDITSIKIIPRQLHVLIKSVEITSTYMKLRDISTASGRRDGRCRQARIKRAAPVHNTANPCPARDWPTPTPMSTNNPHGVTLDLLGPYTSRDLSFALVDFIIAHRPSPLCPRGRIPSQQQYLRASHRIVGSSRHYFVFISSSSSSSSSSFPLNFPRLARFP